jgi:hypothetical protein
METKHLTAKRLGHQEQLTQHVQRALEGKELVGRCAWCGRLRASGHWNDQAVVLRDNTVLTHTICPDCVSDLRRNGLSH